MEVFNLIAEVGVPIAGALIMAYFIFLVMKQLMGSLVDEIKTVQGITKMLITRASIMNNDIIRIDTSVSSALNLPPDLDRIARAENFVEDGKIDARRDKCSTRNKYCTTNCRLRFSCGYGCRTWLFCLLRLGYYQ